MQAIKQRITHKETKVQIMTNDIHAIEKAVHKSFAKIAPSWPLKNLIAVNPMAGFEDLPFEEALQKAQVHFQQKNFPEGMQNVNRESIKWLQVFFRRGTSHD